ERLDPSDQETRTGISTRHPQGSGGCSCICLVDHRRCEGGNYFVFGVSRPIAEPSEIKWPSVRKKMRPPAIAGVLWVASPRSLRASTLNSSVAASTTTLPSVAVQYNRSPADTGDAAYDPTIRSDHTTFPVSVRSHEAMPCSESTNTRSFLTTGVGICGTNFS